MNPYKRFNDINVNEQFRKLGRDYVKIENVWDAEGDCWNAIDMEHYCLAYFWNEEWVEV